MKSSNRHFFSRQLAKRRERTRERRPLIVVLQISERDAVLLNPRILQCSALVRQTCAEFVRWASSCNTPTRGIVHTYNTLPHSVTHAPPSRDRLASARVLRRLQDRPIVESFHKTATMMRISVPFTTVSFMTRRLLVVYYYHAMESPAASSFHRGAHKVNSAYIIRFFRLYSTVNIHFSSRGSRALSNNLTSRTSSGTTLTPTLGEPQAVKMLHFHTHYSPLKFRPAESIFASPLPVASSTTCTSRISS